MVFRPTVLTQLKTNSLSTRITKPSGLRQQSTLADSNDGLFNFKSTTQNCVADDISRIPCLPSTDPTVLSVCFQHQNNPSSLHPIQPIQHISDVQEGDQILFSYEEPDTFIMAMEDEIHQIQYTLFRLQSECHDYMSISSNIHRWLATRESQTQFLSCF